MIIAVNDMSFLKGFESPYAAREALRQFADVGLGLKDERVSKVNMENNIVNSPVVNKTMMVAPEYTLIRALYDIREENMEQFLFIIQMLALCGEGNVECTDEFSAAGCTSTFCAYHRNDFLLSIVSDEAFKQERVKGVLNGSEECEIRNISDVNHKYTYWEDLGFREYELNEKHGNKIYYRAGGIKVDIAPETDELGQQLLNKAVEIDGKLFSVDTEKDNRIFEFRHSYANKYHAFRQSDLPVDLQKKIYRVFEERKHD